ncbi:methyltransferase family protein [Saccharomonospora marina XMU15]|uniref:Methyltransferase family protein n=1 Tax=Saccharomonospora marina XMU15 TaxID=882083 RepID=H5XBY7_9PSEU|nr:methyltransferase family protein [Saccharomonospora marina XMU15]
MATGPTHEPDCRCRICGSSVREFFDFGMQPVANGFVSEEQLGQESFFRLSVGVCTNCTMVQLTQEVPRSTLFHADYPYRSSGSAIMREHFESFAHSLLHEELSGPDPLVVEIGSNDGIMLKKVSDAGVRHVGVDPSAAAAKVAAAKGVNVRVEFFEESSAAAIRDEYGPADVIFSANTFSHIADIGSVLNGVDILLAGDGTFVFEDRYLGDIVAKNYFDQIYDEHFYLFSVASVRTMAARHGFELVDATRLPVHGGSVRYVLARAGSRPTHPRVELFLRDEDGNGITAMETLTRFGENIDRIRHDLVTLLRDLRARGKHVVGYGATSKSTTVLNYCGIGTELIPRICDSTPEKQGTFTPGVHIPVTPPETFHDPFPDYALLFAWNHAEEIFEKETEFVRNGGEWILYVPRVHIHRPGSLPVVA